jgi:hypothetical protein
MRLYFITVHTVCVSDLEKCTLCVTCHRVMLLESSILCFIVCFCGLVISVSASGLHSHSFNHFSFV